MGQLEASSPGKAAAILAAPDPLAALRKNEDDWDFGDSPAGGIRPLAHPGARLLHQLEANAALMRQVNLHTFPVMLYRTANGRAHLIVGLLPENAIATVLRQAHALFRLQLSVRRSCHSRHLTGWQGVALQI